MSRYNVRDRTGTQCLRIALSMGLVGVASTLLAGESDVSQLPVAAGEAVRHTLADDRQEEPSRLTPRGSSSLSGPRRLPTANNVGGLPSSSLIESDTGVRWAVPVVAPARRPIALVQATEGVATPQDSSTNQESGAPDGTSAFRSIVRNSSALGQLGASALTAAASVTGLQMLAATDAGTLLDGQVDTVVRFVSPIFSEPVQRGRRIGRLRGEGSFWVAARQDLDTFYSKIDSELVEQIVSISGPYTARMGPGFAFYDVELLKAPRFQNGSGYEAHGRTKLSYTDNGNLWHARQSLWGGSHDWGYRIGYGHRGGDDYETGAGFSLPTSFKSGVADFAIGKDITPDDHFDFQYFRLDQSPVELPGQFFDLKFLKTDSFEVSYVRENLDRFDVLETEGWYNRTRFTGDNLRPGKRSQIPFLDANDIESVTDADTISTGYKLALSVDDYEDDQLTIGSDLRYVRQQLNEYNRSSNGRVNSPPGIFVNSPIPKSEQNNPGLFLEHNHEFTKSLRVTAGGRFDWVSTDAQRRVDVTGDGVPDDLAGLFDTTSLKQTFDLWAAFMTAEFDVNNVWTLSGAVGHGMRPPTLTEMYAVGSSDNIGPFIAVLPQYAFTTVRGDPELAAEDAWQLDISLRAETDRLRAGATGFYSWIRDYITLDYLNPQDDGAFYGFVNTDRATLAGAELYVEHDIHPNVTWLSSLSYVEGRDHTRPINVNPVRFTSPRIPISDERSFLAPNAANEEPLYAIAPLEGRWSIIFHSCEPEPLWSCQFSIRAVDSQDRIATSLGEFPTPGFTVYDVEGYVRLTANTVLTAAIYNLTDKAYQEHFDARRGLALPVLQPGQSIFTGLETTF